MLLELFRNPSSAKCTLGKLTVDGVFFCYTLEDVVRAVKVAGETALPAGRYRITLTLSTKFKKVLPLLENVPGFEGVRIHSGNTDEDTEGCILVGTAKGVDCVVNSREAFTALYKRMASAREITIIIHPAGENHGT